MKTIFKKLTIITLICALVLAQINVVFASEELSSTKDNMIYTNEELLVRLGITDYEVKSANSLNNKGYGKNTYKLSETENVTILTNTEKTIEVKFVENEKTNIVKFTSNGKVYIDGKEVYAYDDDGNVINHDLFSNTRAGYTTYYKYQPEYGNSNDYTDYYGEEKSANIDMDNALTNITYLAFRAVMYTYLGVAGQVAADILEQFYDIVIETEPTTTAVSYKAQMHSHRNYSSGYIPSLFTYIWKYDLILYAEAFYETPIETYNLFKHKLTV